MTAGEPPPRFPAGANHQVGGLVGGDPPHDRSEHYEHTQFGRVIALGTLAGLAITSAMLLSLSTATLKTSWVLVIALYGLLAAGFALLWKLTVEVDQRELRFRFGIGVFGRVVPLADIVRCEVIRTRLWWGWGLHWTPSGWLYNVAGRDAVRIEFLRERPVIIGSDDAMTLKRVIDERIARRAKAG
jgi:hypothetical protein